MSISPEIQQKISQFAKEQSGFYLTGAEMTYMEKLRRKADKTRGKVNRKLARFKATSDKGREAQDDLILYMNDYISDLTAGGMSERDAFEKARSELSYNSNTEQSADIHALFGQYFETGDPAVFEAAGLFYGGFIILGVTIGGLTGFLTCGGLAGFLLYGWLGTLIGLVTGALTGVGLGLIAHGITAAIGRK